MFGIDDIRKARESIASRYGVRRFSLFDSYERAEQGESSDFDLVFGETQLYAPAREQYQKDREAIYG